MGRLLLLVLLSGCVSKKNIARAAAQVDLGTANFREGQLEQAVAALQLATDLDPRNWRAWTALALTYAAKGDEEQAERAFDRAVRLNGKEGEVLVNLGAWRAKRGDYAAAVEALEAARADLDYRNQSMILSNLSFAYLQLGRVDEALAASRDAVRRTPSLCEGWFHLGLAQEAKDNAEGALEAYRELIDRCPGEASGARLRMGCVQVRGPVPELGLRPLEQVVADEAGTPLADEARACMRVAGS